MCSIKITQTGKVVKIVKIQRYFLLFFTILKIYQCEYILRKTRICFNLYSTYQPLLYPYSLTLVNIFGSQ